MSYGFAIQTQNKNSNSASLLRTAIFGRDWRVTLLRAAIWAAIIITTREFILTPIRVSGISMLPTYRDREIDVINRLAYLRHGPQRGDVVAVRTNPLNLGGEFGKLPVTVLFKRIIGLPGETVIFASGRVLINGKILKEPYETLDCDWNIGPWKLGADEYFIVGDNRAMDEQLHIKGRCKRSQIVGKAVF